METRVKTKYGIDNLDLGISYQDIGPWRSYHLTCYGNTLAELLKDATISEVDQDGEELVCYGYVDISSYEVAKAVDRAIQDLFKGRVA